MNKEYMSMDEVSFKFRGKKLVDGAPKVEIKGILMLLLSG